VSPLDSAVNCTSWSPCLWHWFNALLMNHTSWHGLLLIGGCTPKPLLSHLVQSVLWVNLP
jgi:hypothetical protein